MQIRIYFTKTRILLIVFFLQISAQYIVAQRIETKFIYYDLKGIGGQAGYLNDSVHFHKQECSVSLFFKSINGASTFNVTKPDGTKIMGAYTDGKKCRRKYNLYTNKKFGLGDTIIERGHYIKAKRDGIWMYKDTKGDIYKTVKYNSGKVNHSKWPKTPHSPTRAR